MHQKIEPTDPKLGSVAECFESYTDDSGTGIQPELAKLERTVAKFLEHYPFLTAQESEIRRLVEQHKKGSFSDIVKAINSNDSAPEFDECNCTCHHSDSHVRHCTPCCSQCDHCGRNIRHGSLEAHIAHCVPTT